MANRNTHRNVVDIKPNVHDLDTAIARDLQATASGNDHNMNVQQHLRNCMATDGMVKLHSQILLKQAQKIESLEAKIEGLEAKIEELAQLLRKPAIANRNLSRVLPVPKTRAQILNLSEADLDSVMRALGIDECIIAYDTLDEKQKVLMREVEVPAWLIAL
ncbi:hypothetical protein BLS_007927 [Venturia inaequalis]|nr:hypothetical protein BLS_007927 [Venturia inaequalis]